MSFTSKTKTGPEGGSKPGESNESTTQSGSQSTCTDKSIAARVSNPSGEKLIGVDVVLSDDGGTTLDTKKTGELGVADFGQKPPGKYRLQVQKPFFVNGDGDPVVEARFDHRDSKNTLEDLILIPVEAHLFLDADRNGELTRQEPMKWDTTKGAILTNCNNPKPGKIDKLDGIAPLEVRLTPPNAKGVTATISLVKTDPGRIWIYPELREGAQGVLGGFKGPITYEWELTSKNGQFGMAAGRFDLMKDAKTAEPEIIIQLDVLHQGQAQEPESGKVRVAPWMIPSSLLPAELVYAAPWVAREMEGPFRNNELFRRELSQSLGDITFDETTLKQEGDRWAQDCCEFGYSRSNLETLAVVLRAPRRDITLAGKVKALRAEKVGVVEWASPPKTTESDSDLDKFGNLEVTPPLKIRTPTTNKDYPFGRIYYGARAQRHPKSAMDQTIRSMLHAQRVQSPFQLDTSFLDVGHVDEVISFVSCDDG